MGAHERVREHVEESFLACVNKPSGCLTHPYIDPGGGYRSILFDWDAYFCLVGLEPWAAQLGPVAVGCVRNFLEHQRPDGSVPYALTPKAAASARELPVDDPRNSAKPLLAQFAVLAARYSGATDWLTEVYPAIRQHCSYWEQRQVSRLGLLTFRSHRGSGADDNPAVFGRPLNSSADVFLNSLMVMEYRAMARLAKTVGSADEAEEWTRKADTLAGRMVDHMWDPVDGMYYNLDVGAGNAGKVNRTESWVVPLKFRTWTAVAPLWASVAPAEQAKRLVKEHLLNPAELRSPHGVRSLARNEPAYEIAVGSNPSCWRGPVRIVANYLAWRGLINYGFTEEATALARDVTDLLARDLETTGTLHEYYHPDTGEGLTHPGFLNWNTLALVMQ